MLIVTMVPFLLKFLMTSEAFLRGPDLRLELRQQCSTRMDLEVDEVCLSWGNFTKKPIDG